MSRPWSLLKHVVSGTARLSGIPASDGKSNNQESRDGAGAEALCFKRLFSFSFLSSDSPQRHHRVGRLVQGRTWIWVFLRRCFLFCSRLHQWKSIFCQLVMITSELGWAMCRADVAVFAQQQMNLLCWSGMFLPGYRSGHRGSVGVYGELQSLLQTSAPPPSAGSKVQLSVYTWGWFHRPRKSVCVQVHVYSHMHICTGMWREAAIFWPTWLESTKSHKKGKVQRVKSRLRCSWHGIKDCFQASCILHLYFPSMPNTCLFKHKNYNKLYV